MIPTTIVSIEYKTQVTLPNFMIQKDYIQRMIDSLSKVLGQLMGMKPPKGLELIQEAYQEHLKIEGDWLDGLAESDLLDILVNDKQFNVHQIEFLAELLAKEGELLLKIGEPTLANTKFRKALLLFDYVETESGEYSFERRTVISNVKNMLSTSANS